MKRLFLSLLILNFIFSCEDKNSDKKKSERPKSYSEQWNIKGNVKSVEKTIYNVSEKFGEFEKQGIIKEPFFDSDEYHPPKSKTTYNKYGDPSHRKTYNSEGDRLGSLEYKFNSEDIPIGYKWKSTDDNGSSKYILDNNKYTEKIWGYDGDRNLISLTKHKRNKDGRLIKLSSFHNHFAMSKKEFEKEIRNSNNNIPEYLPYQVMKWKYDKKGNWIETSIYRELSLNSITKLKYDKDDNRISHKTYDSDGDLISRWEYTKRDKMNNWIERVRYDKDNNVELLEEVKIKYYK